MSNFSVVVFNKSIVKKKLYANCRHPISSRPISKPLSPNDKKSNHYQNDQHYVWNPMRMTNLNMIQHSPNLKPNYEKRWEAQSQSPKDNF